MSLKKKIRFYQRLEIKLAVWYTLTFLITTILIFGFLDYRLRHNLLKEIDRMLVDDAHEIINEVLKDPKNLTIHLEELKETISRRKFYRIAFRILDNQENLIYSSPQLRGIDFPFPNLTFNLSHQKRFICKNLEIPSKSSPFRLCTYFYEENNQLKYIVQVATYLRPLKKTIINFRRNLAIAFFLAILFGSLGGWLLSRRSLRPIDKITATTEKITATNLSQRLPLQGTNDELDRLAITINKMIERLEKSFQKLTQFTADAAHELRTPLAALKGETEILLSRKRSSEEYREALANNLERLNFLIRIVNDLLLLSQADEGSESLQIEDVNLTELLKELWEAFNLVAAQKNINFTIDGSEELFIKGDRIKLTQLFSNLIDNAIKYTSEGGKITLTLHNENGKVKTILKDNGIGIPEDEIPRIFDRFYRVDKSRSRRLGGVGLGLSLCQWIVEAHQGTIKVESKLHQGSTFTVILPASPDNIYS